MTHQLAERTTAETTTAPSRPSILEGDLDQLLQREWLITNGRGGYASGTVVGLPTRRYHGLLIAAARPPLERWLLLSAVLERIGVCGRHHEMASFEFDRIIHPQGYACLKDFTFSNNVEMPWARFVYAHDGVQLIKEVVLPRGRDAVSIRYQLQGPPGEPISLELCPMMAMRDFHALTEAFEGSYPIHEFREFVTVDAYESGPRVWLSAERVDGGRPVKFDRRPDWWYGFRYRVETARGQADHEDLFSPGWFCASGQDSIEMEFHAVADFSPDLSGMPEAGSVGRVGQLPERKRLAVEDRLREAASAFVVTRHRQDGPDLTTILAGYHWFGDWGRDTFIALPGLLLETGRFAEAKQVLEVFAASQSDGLIPNRFSDYGEGRDYNSVDASVWFIHAANAYVEASGDDAAWRETLGPACARIVDAFAAGTKFNIHVDADGLVACGEASTQLTWMDAKFGDTVFTPRHGKPVEVNALWYSDLRMMALRFEADGDTRSARYAEMAATVERNFATVFWNEKSHCLFDVVRDGYADPAVRPNQILAVSLPFSPLNKVQQEGVLRRVENRLLTPFGLRSLCQKHPSYAGRYEGDSYARDSVYHQGTVWGWLIGPYAEAYLRVHGFLPEAKRRIRERLVPLIDHLDEAGLDSVSEIFDGDAPHTPRGCIAQGWSVAELLRAWRLSAPDPT